MYVASYSKPPFVKRNRSDPRAAGVRLTLIPMTGYRKAVQLQKKWNTKFTVLYTVVQVSFILEYNFLWRKIYFPRIYIFNSVLFLNLCYILGYDPFFEAFQFTV